jgi:co-chaperonin GroES (HSP10)
MIVVKGCRILVKPLKLEEQDQVYARAKAARIALPEFTERKEKINVDRGTILQIGKMCHEDYTEGLKVGDVIGYTRFGGKYITDTDEQEYLVINDEDVICVIKE